MRVALRQRGGGDPDELALLLQLREVLGEAFIGLEYIPGETPGYAVSMLVGDSEERFVDIDVEAAYARAALAFLAST